MLVAFSIVEGDKLYISKSHGKNTFAYVEIKEITEDEVVCENIKEGEENTVNVIDRKDFCRKVLVSKRSAINCGRQDSSILDK